MLVSTVKAVVADHFGLTLAEMEGDRRSERVARPRQIAMWLAARHTGKSLTVIGRCFDRDHTTVAHAIGVVNDAVARNARPWAPEARFLDEALGAVQ